jgi:succinyl-CoA synthetase beta subunit
MDCGLLAQGIVEACKQDPLRVPLIVRMEGTNVDIGKNILKESKLNIITADTMADGAEQAVQAAYSTKK